MLQEKKSHNLNETFLLQYRHNQTIIKPSYNYDITEDVWNSKKINNLGEH